MKRKLGEIDDPSAPKAKVGTKDLHFFVSWKKGHIFFRCEKQCLGRNEPEVEVFREFLRIGSISAMGPESD